MSAISGAHASARDGDDAGVRALLPLVGWLRGYSPEALARDVVAGVTLAAYAVPVALAYAGLPPVGLYGYLLGGIGYPLFGSSRQIQQSKPVSGLA